MHDNNIIDTIHTQNAQSPVDAQGEPLSSDDLIDWVRDNYGDTILLSFSMGKDSIALWLFLREHFEIVPYFLYWYPGLAFVEKSLAYYEEWFGTRIMQLPHPLFYNMLRTGAYQEPHVVGTIDWLRLERYDFADIDTVVCEYSDLDPTQTLCAVGFRAADNMERRRLIKQMGTIGFKRRKYYYGIWDWNVQRTTQIIKDNDVAIPPDYVHWGRTIAAFDYQYLQPLREQYPEDFQRLREFFPLIDAEIFRYEGIG